MVNVDKSGELVGRCFQARTEAHIAHLTTKSFAQHKALNEFYDEIVDLADAFAENAQGRAGALLKYPRISPRSSDSDTSKPLTVIEALRTWVDENRDDCGDESELQNLIDEIVALCNSTIYKLTFLS